MAMTASVQLKGASKKFKLADTVKKYTLRDYGFQECSAAINQTVARLANKGKHLITTAAEHSSVYQTMRHLERQGFEVTYLDFDEEGHIDFEELKTSIRKETILVSIMAGNNEVGSLQDIQAIGDLLHEKDIFFHTDTVQTYLNIPLDVEKMHIDALSMSAHKIYGPKGIGFMYYRNAKADFAPYVRGGNQENKHRAGTEALPLILGMSKAIEKQYDNMEKHQDHLKALRQYFLEGARERGFQGDAYLPSNGRGKTDYKRPVKLPIP